MITLLKLHSIMAILKINQFNIHVAKFLQGIGFPWNFKFLFYTECGTHLFNIYNRRKIRQITGHIDPQIVYVQ